MYLTLMSANRYSIYSISITQADVAYFFFDYDYLNEKKNAVQIFSYFLHVA